MHRAAGHLPDQPGVDGTKQELAGPGRADDVGIAIQDPADLGAGEVGVDHQTRAFANGRLETPPGHRVALRRRLPALPDDGRVHRRAGGSVPDDGGLTLVGDPDRLQIATAKACIGDRLLHDPPAGLPDLEWVLFHPSGFRVGQADLAVGSAEHGAVVREDQRGAASGSLVECQHRVGHRGCSLFRRGCAPNPRRRLWGPSAPRRVGAARIIARRDLDGTALRTPAAACGAPAPHAASARRALSRAVT